MERAAHNPAGRIDVHSHLLPGLDDGCPDLEDSFNCIRQLKSHGFIGTICTPHIWQELFPLNTAEHIRGWTVNLQRQINEAGLDYHVWPGGELRLFDGFVRWADRHDIPTLAGSRCVLVDFWEKKWPRWINRSFDWLLSHDYQPILAHPERLPTVSGVEDRIQELIGMGVWLQGNFRCFTGEEGYQADVCVRRWFEAGRYVLMALDMHASDSLPGRFDGMSLVAQTYGTQVLDRFLINAPRDLILH